MRARLEGGLRVILFVLLHALKEWRPNHLVGFRTVRTVRTVFEKLFTRRVHLGRERGELQEPP